MQLWWARTGREGTTVSPTNSTLCRLMLDGWRSGMRVMPDVSGGLGDPAASLSGTRSSCGAVSLSGCRSSCDAEVSVFACEIASYSSSALNGLGISPNRGHHAGKCGSAQGICIAMKTRCTDAASLLVCGMSSRSRGSCNAALRAWQ